MRKGAVSGGVGEPLDTGLRRYGGGWGRRSVCGGSRLRGNDGGVRRVRGWLGVGAGNHKGCPYGRGAGAPLGLRGFPPARERRGTGAGVPSIDGRAILESPLRLGAGAGLWIPACAGMGGGRRGPLGLRGFPPARERRGTGAGVPSIDGRAILESPLRLGAGGWVRSQSLPACSRCRTPGRTRWVCTRARRRLFCRRIRLRHSCRRGSSRR